MNDIKKIDPVKSWNENLHKLMKDNGYKQATFASALVASINAKTSAETKASKNAKPFKCSQRDVSRWLRVGETETTANGEERIIGFPTYYKMMSIANFFNVQVGFLTGETDGEDFDYEKASNYMGLNVEAIKSLKSIASPDEFLKKSHRKTPSITLKHHTEFLNKLFTHEKFFFFLESMCELDELYNTFLTHKADWEDPSLDKVTEKYGQNVLDLALDALPIFEGIPNNPSNQDLTNIENDLKKIVNEKFSNQSTQSKLDLSSTPDKTEPNKDSKIFEDIFNACCEINDILDQAYEKQTSFKNRINICRYQLSESFEDLVLSLYPKYDANMGDL